LPTSKATTYSPYFFEEGVWTKLKHKGPVLAANGRWRFANHGFFAWKEKPPRLEGLELFSYLAGPPERRLRVARTFLSLVTDELLWGGMVPIKLPHDNRLYFGGAFQFGAPGSRDSGNSVFTYEHEFARFRLPIEGLPSQLKQYTHCMIPTGWHLLPEAALESASLWKKVWLKRWPGMMVYDLTLPPKAEYEAYFGEAL